MGPLCEMHGNVAAGKITELHFDHAKKAIDVAATVVDPVSRQKCVSGVFQGFSIGGSYLKKWPAMVGNQLATKYTAAPTEISLVDNPCVDSARFSRMSKTFRLVKRDGTTERRRFASPLAQAATNFNKALAAQGSSIQSFLSPRNVTMNINDQGRTAAIYDIRKALRTRRQMLAKGAGTRQPTIAIDTSLNAIRKALGLPVQVAGTGRETKPTTQFGATNNWHDGEPAAPTPARLGGHEVSDVSGRPAFGAAEASATKCDRTVDAIKRAWSGKRRPMTEEELEELEDEEDEE
jgi:hypothetical protein